MFAVQNKKNDDVCDTRSGKLILGYYRVYYKHPVTDIPINIKLLTALYYHLNDEFIINKGYNFMNNDGEIQRNDNHPFENPQIYSTICINSNIDYNQITTWKIRINFEECRKRLYRFYRMGLIANSTLNKQQDYLQNDHLHYAINQDGHSLYYECEGEDKEKQYYENLDTIFPGNKNRSFDNDNRKEDLVMIQVIICHGNLE